MSKALIIFLVGTTMVIVPIASFTAATYYYGGFDEDSVVERVVNIIPGSGGGSAANSSSTEQASDDDGFSFGSLLPNFGKAKTLDDVPAYRSTHKTDDVAGPGVTREFQPPNKFRQIIPGDAGEPTSIVLEIGDQTYLSSDETPGEWLADAGLFSAGFSSALWHLQADPLLCTNPESQQAELKEFSNQQLSELSVAGVTPFEGFTVDDFDTGDSENRGKVATEPCGTTTCDRYEWFSGGVTRQCFIDTKTGLVQRIHMVDPSHPDSTITFDYDVTIEPIATPANVVSAPVLDDFGEVDFEDFDF